jgi:hypothetical protein
VSNSGRRRDGALWQREYKNNAWSSWASLGGQLASNTGPAASAQDANTLDVFVQGTDNALWYRHYQSGSGWSAWNSLSGYLTSDPAAVSRSAGKIDVFVRGGDNKLWGRSYDNGWGQWTSVGGA